jgi:hypothetical protein
MRPRNREVNIFNMSLLDILCGALGAFCFLMLALFPDHAKARQLQSRLDELEKSGAGMTASDMREKLDEAENRAEQAEKQLDQAKADQSLMYVQLYWRTGQDVDLWVQGVRSGKWFGPKPSLVPRDQLGGELKDRTKGPAREVLWFSDIAYPGIEYRFFAQLQSTNGIPGPVTVSTYFTARVGADNSAMGLDDFGEMTLTREGERIELGGVRIENGYYDAWAGQKPPAESKDGAASGPPRLLPRLLPKEMQSWR